MGDMNDRAARAALRLWQGVNARRAGWFWTGAVGGLIVGLVLVLARDALIPENFDNDSRKIVSVATGTFGDLNDKSFSSVAAAYRWLGLIGHPTLTAVLSYLLACAAIAAVLWRLQLRRLSLIEGGYVAVALVLSGVYLGTYTKDVFVLPIALFVALMPRRWWSELIIVASMGAYAYFFRSYWVIVLVAYVVVRVVLALIQLRARYLLIFGALGTALIGVGMFVALHMSADHYREQTLSQTRSVVHTTISPLVQMPEPVGGLINVVAAYGLLLAPVLLPFTASAVFAVVTIGIAFIRLLPFLYVSSVRSWPEDSSRPGTLLRRGIALSLGMLVAQALFEPDYGSAIRHFTPLLAISLAMICASAEGAVRVGRTRAWSLTGAAGSTGKRGRRAR
jgi:hypothetical protein